MEMQETERELRRTMDHLDPPPNRAVASSIPPASSHVRSLPPSSETGNTIQTPAVKPHTPQAQAAVPTDKSSAEDGAGSSTQGSAETTNTEEHD